MHLFYTARDITSHALGTIVSAMGPCGALGAMGSSALSILLLQFVLRAPSAQRLLKRSGKQSETS